MTIDQLENLISGFGQDSLKLHDTVFRDLSSASVVLFAINDHTTGEQLELAGSGTLVSRGDSYWILTASHVWEKKSTRKLVPRFRRQGRDQFRDHRA